MISTFEIVSLVFLAILLGVAAWWFGVAFEYRKSVESFSYGRGANLDTGRVGNGKTGKGAVNMGCSDGHEICVWHATAICTGANAKNIEQGHEPISNGIDGKYGDLNPATKVDVTNHMSLSDNGKTKYTYNFDGLHPGDRSWPTGSCAVTYDNNTETGVRPQLIATYSCIPTGTKCRSKLA